jgi:asparagine synthase (glutamine-hydrolysing)
VCGICGVFTTDESITIYGSPVPAMTALMERRGPDDEGYWSDGHHAAFGFRRLSIIDPTPAGHQPMVSADGRYVLIFNGELYNFRELKADLMSAGITFHTRSDTEVVLQGLAHWGEEALKRFNGMFALAFYDAKERALLLARDPLGIKPLYYLRHEKAVVFASQYDQILIHPLCDRSSLRADVLGLYLRFGFIPAPYALINGTHQLEPGTYLAVSPGYEPRCVRYFDFPMATEPDLRGYEAIDVLDAAVHAAVQRQTVSDVPLGTFLSGGVDSPLVTAMAAADRERPLPAFSIGTTTPDFDESDAARGYANALNVDHHLDTFTADDALGMLDEVTAAYSEPFADFSGFPMMMVSAVAKRSVKVALSGDGGDELFWGYPRFRKVLDASSYFAYPRAMRTGRYALGRLIQPLAIPEGVRFPSIGHWYLDAHSGLKTSDLMRLSPDVVQLPEGFHIYDGAEQKDKVRLAQWLRWNEVRSHLQQMLLKVDRASMFHSLEVRVPLLDVELLKVALRIHPDDAMAGSVGKRHLRALLSRRIPAASIPEAKKGFSVPMRHWLRDELKPLVHDVLLAKDPFPSGLFDRSVIQQIYDDHLSGRPVQTRRLWNLLALQLWSERHLRSPQARLTSPQKTSS